MAFSKTPATSTYQTKAIRLVRELNSRGVNTNKDEDYINCYPELIKNRNTKENELYLVKRPGASSFITSVDSSDVRGLFHWESQNKLFVIVSNDIYIYNSGTGTLITTITDVLATTSGHVGMCEFLYDTGAVKVVITDGTALMTVDTANAAVATVDADMPVHLPYPVFLDGYLFIIKSGTADIYNSNLNDPLAYTAGDFITAEMIADNANFMTRINNYLIVVGDKSIEYFWDAANASGSPLQRNDTPVKLTGYMGGFAALGNKVFIIGSNNDSQPDIFVLEDFKMSPIGTEAIRRHLASITVQNVTTIKAALISQNGHDFYVFNTGSGCYSYDVESKLWSRWTWQNTSNFGLTHAVNAETTSGYRTFFALSGTTAIYKMDYTLYQDSGATFPCVIVTDNEEFDTMNQKTMARLTVWADRTTTSAAATIQWSDDDYQSYNTGVDVDMALELPCIRRLGRFRSRAFKITFTQNQPMRIKSLEVDINLGQH